MDALRAAVRHRRGLVADRRVAQQRMHDQLNALMSGFIGACWAWAVLAAGLTDRAGGAGLRAAFAGRPPRLQSLTCRAPGTFDHEHRAVLGAAVAWLSAAAG